MSQFPLPDYQSNETIGRLGEGGPGFGKQPWLRRGALDGAVLVNKHSCIGRASESYGPETPFCPLVPPGL